MTLMTKLPSFSTLQSHCQPEYCQLTIYFKFVSDFMFVRTKDFSKIMIKPLKILKKQNNNNCLILRYCVTTIFSEIVMENLEVLQP